MKSLELILWIPGLIILVFLFEIVLKSFTFNR